MKYNNKITLMVCVALSLVACSPDKTSEEYLSAAKANISASKNAEAIIALKNALRVDLQNAEARILLGSFYLNMGEASAAEKELSRGLDLSGDIDNILPKLLKALNLQNKSEETLSLIAKHEKLTPEILLYQALAYKQLGERSKAKQSIVRANELSTESIYSQLGDAYLKADSSNIDGALESISKILNAEPSLTEALMLKGQLYFAKKDYVNALNAFNEYHNMLPNDAQIRLFLANTYIKNEQFDEANKHLNFLLTLVPEHAFTNQLKGLIYYQESEYKQALAHTEKAIQNGLDTASNKVVAGLSAFKLAQYELAHQYLVTLSELLSSTHPVRRVLALVQMQLGYSGDASDTLEGIEGLTSQDVNLFTTASFELLKAGKIDKAKKLLAKTDNVIADSSQEMTKLGVLKLSMNDLEGLADLEKAVEMDPELPMAKITLAAAYIQSKEYDKALDVAKQWKHDQPNQVEGYNLVAKVLLLQEKTVAAEAELKHALTIKADNAFSLLYFASKALMENKPEEAISLINKVLNARPNYIKALVLYYRANKVIDNTDEAVRKIANSFDSVPQNLANRLLYSRVLFIEQDFEKVIELLKNIDGNEALPPHYWILLSDSYLKTKQSAKALAVINNWIEAEPLHRAARLRKISIQEKFNDFLGALATVDSVLKIIPTDDQFRVLRGYYLIRNKQFNIAQTQINSLSEKLKKLPLVQGLQGEIWLTEGKHAQAISGLKALHEMLPTPYNAALVFATLKNLKQDQSAFDFLVQHVESNPKDFISKTFLAENAVAFDKNLAKKHYLVLLQSSPNNLPILNNLAWIEYELTNYQAADELAVRALKLDNNNPQVLDTAGLIKLKLGEKGEAVKLLKKASQLAPEDKEIAKHYQEVIN